MHGERRQKMVGEGGLSNRSLVRCPADDSDMANLRGSSWRANHASATPRAIRPAT